MYHRIARMISSFFFYEYSLQISQFTLSLSLKYIIFFLVVDLSLTFQFHLLQLKLYYGPLF